MDNVELLYGILDGHCLAHDDMDCNNPGAPYCIWCLASYLDRKGVMAPEGSDES